jgi:hypothetical protein
MLHDLVLSDNDLLDLRANIVQGCPERLDQSTGFFRLELAR